MRRFAIALGLAALAAGAAAGPSTTCETFENAYHDELGDLEALYARPDFVEWPRSGSRFIDAALHPFAIWKSAERVAYDNAVPAQARRVAALHACGVERQCAWATDPSPEVERMGRMLPEARCDVW